MSTDEIIEEFDIIYSPKKIEEIKNRITFIGSRNFKPTYHCLERVGGDISLRGFSMNLVYSTLPKLEKIRKVKVRRLKKGDIGNDIFYELSGNQTLIITLCFETKMIINSILKFQKWQNFISKKYGYY